jgi:hypothetical protein
VDIIYQVGNWTTESQYWGRPEDLSAQNMPRPAYNVSTVDGASDLAGQMAAAFASAAIVFNRTNASYSQTLLSAATTLYSEAVKHQGKYTDGFIYTCTSRFAKSLINTNRTALCPTPQTFAGGSALVAYNSTSYRDDLVWAAAWMYKATRNTSYLQDAANFYGEYQLDESSNDDRILADYNNLFYPSNVLLAQATNEGAYHRVSQQYLAQWVCGAGGLIRYTPRGRAWNKWAPTLGDVGTAAFLAGVYGQVSSSYISAAKQQKYICWSRGQIRYMLGDASRSLVAGYGKNPPTQVQNKAASCPNAPATCNITQLYINKPNPHVLTGALVYQPDFSDAFLNERPLNASRAGILNNVGFTAAAAGLNQAPGSWEQCLQGQGVLTTDTSVCNPVAT